MDMDGPFPPLRLPPTPPKAHFLLQRRDVTPTQRLSLGGRAPRICRVRPRGEERAPTRERMMTRTTVGRMAALPAAPLRGSGGATSVSAPRRRARRIRVARAVPSTYTQVRSGRTQTFLRPARLAISLTISPRVPVALVVVLRESRTPPTSSSSPERASSRARA